ncbi:uncharacterized protein LOC129799095 [Phlebotomus papatasi]|uniref:uncharacterized protein LOC129799095 n=1 Tax=Phlebotomus papatasi TaxID=29031 RepID=UPI00248438EF|nr:uncharacterized protein LOC129799095 [Phlebotomus papatasi]
MEEVKLKRIRTKNFTEEEKQFLTKLVEKHQKTLGVKRNLIQTRYAKLQAWEAITLQYNKCAELPRTVDQLKALHKNMKLEQKKKNKQDNPETESETTAEDDGAGSLMKMSLMEDELQEDDPEPAKRMRIEEPFPPFPGSNSDSSSSDDDIFTASYPDFQDSRRRYLDVKWQLLEQTKKNMEVEHQMRINEHKRTMEILKLKLEYQKMKMKLGTAPLLDPKEELDID